MLPLQHVRRWHIASVAFLVIVMIVAMMPAIWFWEDLARSGAKIFDKWLHFATFLILALWFAGQYRRQSYWLIALGLFSFGILIEICQRMVSYRTGDLIDLFADSAGILIGLSIAFAGIGGWSVRFEQWLQYRARSD